MAALLQAYEPVDSLSPFGFLLQGKNLPGENALAPHLGWLKQNHMVSADEEGLLPNWAKAIKIAARPSSRITITDTMAEKKRRVLCVANGQEMIFAMFDRQHCLISEPFSYEVSVERLVRSIGLLEAEQPQPLVTSPDVVRIMGALAEAGLAERPTKHLSAREKSQPARTLSEQRAAEVLGEVLRDPVMGSALLVDMMADKLILEEQGKVWVHPQFLPWHRVISSGAMLEVVRQDLAAGESSQEVKLAQRAVFLGAVKERCLTWPSPGQNGEVILAYPTRKQLREILMFVLGAPDNSETSLRETLARSSQKFSFRG